MSLPYLFSISFIATLLTYITHCLTHCLSLNRSLFLCCYPSASHTHSLAVARCLSLSLRVVSHSAVTHRYDGEAYVQLQAIDHSTYTRLSVQVLSHPQGASPTPPSCLSLPARPLSPVAPHTLYIQGIYTPPPPPYPRPCARHNKTPGGSECTVINLPFGGPLPRASSCVTKPGCGPTYTHLTVNIWYSPIDSRQNYNTVHHWIDARFRIIFHK